MSEVVYLAGPMGPESFGLTEAPEDWDWNHPEFNRVAEIYREAGYTVVNPAELDVEAGDVGQKPWDFYLRRDIKVLTDCTRIVMLPGWENSKGARLEHHIADQLGLSVEYRPGAKVAIRDYAPPNLLDGTAEFNRLAGLLGEPRFGSGWEIERVLRRDLLAEEFKEYLDAERDNDLVEVVDGLLDIIVVAYGSLLIYVGEEKAKAAAAEVVRSNLDKVTGEIRRRPDGKIQKPEGWRAPDIAGVLA